MRQASSRLSRSQKYFILAGVNAIPCLICVGTKQQTRWEVITHCRSQIIIYSYQNLITSSSSIYTSVLNTIICNIWVWRVQLIYEDPEESSATGPIWEWCGLYTASFGNFKLRLFISSSSSVIVLLAQHHARSLKVCIPFIIQIY